MNPDRKRLHVELDEADAEAWHSKAFHLGVPTSSLVAVVARRLDHIVDTDVAVEALRYTGQMRDRTRRRDR